ncbi:MAG TPA: EAL domain-containing protein [Gammaproteobacteria bacterium]|nr:EAL domain-containing protein [Gammaproteobacteria bacterium]
MKIRNKLTLTFLPLTLITLVTLGSLAYFSSKNALTRQVLDNLDNVAAIQKQRIESIFEQNRERLLLVSSRTQLRLSLKKYLNDPRPQYTDEMNRILNDAGATITDFRALFIQTPDGRIVASTRPELIGTVHAETELFNGTYPGMKVDLFYRDANGRLGAYLAGPLYLGPELLGVLVIDSDISNIVASTTDYHGLGETGETLLIRRHGNRDARFITPARFDDQAALQRTVSGELASSPYIQVLLKQDRLLTDARDYTGHSIIAVTRYIDPLNLGLVVQKRTDEAYAPIDTLRKLLLSLIALFSITVIFASLYIARSITLPISRLTEVASRISSGNLSERADISTHDETGLLANAFNRMTENLIDDINERRQAEEKFQSLLKSAPDAIIIVEQDGSICLTNLQAEQLFGYSSTELLGKPIELLVPDRRLQRHPPEPDTAMDKELYGVHRNGARFPIEISLAPIKTHSGLLTTMVIRDVTERKQAEALLIKQANYDTLTGLPNRLLAADRLSQALAHAHRKGLSVAIMFLDIDRFKNVNDTLGHSVGDKLLTGIAARLRESVHEDDTVARLGGDEFLIILPELETLTAAEIVAEKILAALSLPFRLDDRELFTSTSIGITGYPEDSDNPDILLRNADSAMYQAKDAGRNTFRFFTPEMNIRLLKRLEMESQLRYAMHRQELSLHFQPQVDIKNGRLVGAEALLRWKNPELGNVPPGDFIPLAEETGLINDIGEWVLIQACQAAVAWQSHAPDGIRVSVNVSAVQFRGTGLVRTVRHALDVSGLSAPLLELEITERLLVEDNPNTSRILEDIKHMGVRLSLDDFGKGYSSLSYLKRFPFDVLKIDRAFISGVTTNTEDAALCRAITAMASSLNLLIVAEGVETQEQWHFLDTHGADLVQGYFISRPLDADGFYDYLSARRTQAQ